MSDDARSASAAEPNPETPESAWFAAMAEGGSWRDDVRRVSGGGEAARAWGAAGPDDEARDAGVAFGLAIERARERGGERSGELSELVNVVCMPAKRRPSCRRGDAAAGVRTPGEGAAAPDPPRDGGRDARLGSETGGGMREWLVVFALVFVGLVVLVAGVAAFALLVVAAGSLAAARWGDWWGVAAGGLVVLAGLAALLTAALNDIDFW